MRALPGARDRLGYLAVRRRSLAHRVAPVCFSGSYQFEGRRVRCAGRVRRVDQDGPHSGPYEIDYEMDRPEVGPTKTSHQPSARETRTGRAAAVGGPAFLCGFTTPTVPEGLSVRRRGALRNHLSVVGQRRAAPGSTPAAEENQRPPVSGSALVRTRTIRATSHRAAGGHNLSRGSRVYFVPAGSLSGALVGTGLEPLQPKRSDSPTGIRPAPRENVGRARRYPRRCMGSDEANPSTRAQESPAGATLSKTPGVGSGATKDGGPGPWIPHAKGQSQCSSLMSSYRTA